jgi:hypothetical protein
VQHYEDATRISPGSDLAHYRERAERQVRAAINFVPRYYGVAACELLVLAGLAGAARRRPTAVRWICPTLLGLTLVELVCFGFNLNPAIAAEIQHYEPPVISRLRLGLAPQERAMGIGEELPPNVLMRFGLSDPRNYDSVELARNLRWFEPLYEPGEAAQTSRRQVTWQGVIRARDRLREGSVAAIVGATAPPPDQFDHIEQVGDAWIAWLGAPGWVTSHSARSDVTARRGPNSILITARAAVADRLVIRETWDPGWRALIDGKPAQIDQHRQTFMAVSIPAGDHIVELEYEPMEAKQAMMASVLGLFAVILALTRSRHF